MLSLFFSSIAVTELSFSSAGARSFSLSCTIPVSCLDSAEVLASRFDDGVAALLQHADQVVGVEQQGVHLLAALRQRIR